MIRNPEETFSYDAAHVKVWIKWLIMIFIDLNGVFIIFMNYPDCYYFLEAKFYKYYCRKRSKYLDNGHTNEICSNYPRIRINRFNIPSSSSVLDET